MRTTTRNDLSRSNLGHGALQLPGRLFNSQNFVLGIHSFPFVQELCLGMLWLELQQSPPKREQKTSTASRGRLLRPLKTKRHRGSKMLRVVDVDDYPIVGAEEPRKAFVPSKRDTIQ